MYVNTEIADKYQEFFNFMSQEHDLILTMSEMDEIVSEAQKLVKKLAIPLVVGQSEQLVCPECKSTDCKTAIHTDYKECNKCYHYWEAN